MALPLSAGRMMMFSFCWMDFKDVDCFLVMFLSGDFALRMIELRSARMVSTSSAVSPVNVVSILARKLTPSEETSAQSLPNKLFPW